MTGTLYLLPMLLGESHPDISIPGEVQNITTSLSHFYAENIKTTRRYLRKLDKSFDIDGSHFYVLNKKTNDEDLSEMMNPLLQGFDGGIISEAGLPGIGDPGSKLVRLAHKKNIKVKPLTGPSSFVLALVASGLNGQSFAFNGYLPVKGQELTKKIQEIEKRSTQLKQTQIFMETPYRNNQLLEQLLKTCHSQTQLCIAVNITTDQENILAQSINQWKSSNPDLHKKPAVFAILKA